MIKKKDFIEIDFTGIIKETGQVFDTTFKEKAKQIGIEKVKPIRICVGEGMLVKGFDEAIEGKEIGKNYSIELEPKKAFGQRNPNLVKLIPVAVFHRQRIDPYPGQVLNMDGMIARISSVSGGRVITDFNNPLAGKTIVYEFRINKIIEEKTEQAKAIVEFFIGDVQSKIEGNKIIVEIDKKMRFDKNPIEKKLKDLVGMDLEIAYKK